MEESALSPEAIARRAADLALERKAVQLLILDVRGRSSYTDFLVIASGTSDRHVGAIADLIGQGLRDHNIRPIGSEGLREGQWALLDFGSVVVHIFHPITRELYDLEELWREAPRVPLDETASASGR